MKVIVLFLLKFTLFLSVAKCAKILGVFPTPGYSQYRIGSSLLVGLAEKGHDVTVISEHETKGIKNYKNLLMEKTEPAVPVEEFYKMRNYNFIQNTHMMYYYGEGLVKNTLSDKNVQRLIYSNETFDLVIMEQVYSDGLFAFATHFKAKLIIVSTVGLTESNAYLIGNPIPSSYVPTFNSGYHSQMIFYERVRNTMCFVYDTYRKYFDSLPAQQKLVHTYFPGKIDLQQASNNISLIFLNSHVSIGEALPITHAVKEIGGLHIKSKPLPKEIKEFLDSAERGAILFSMGSNLRSSDFPQATLNKIINDFSKLDQKVLWKFEADNLESIPENVMVSKWLPQTDILAHPNMVAFISHGGLLSTTESMHFGIPMIGIPVFIDQWTNIERVVKFGAGVKLSYDKLEDGSLLNAVTEVLSNSSYKENALKRSQLFKDRLVPPMEEAIFWVEYVLRNNDTRHLRSPILDLRWHQVYLLDITAAFLGFIVIKLCGFIVQKLVVRPNRNKKNN